MALWLMVSCAVRARLSLPGTKAALRLRRQAISRTPGLYRSVTMPSTLSSGTTVPRSLFQ